jgi:hypothetical protein
LGDLKISVYSPWTSISKEYSIFIIFVNYNTYLWNEEHQNSKDKK